MTLTESAAIKIGSSAPNFNLPATDDKNYTLSDFKDSKGFVVVFTCNHCPYAIASWPIIVKLANEFKEKGISFIAINSNDAREYPEDSFEEMKKKVNVWHINFPYLRDETQETAKGFRAVCTPDIFVYDNDRKLYYHGRINDNWQEPSMVVTADLKDALNSLLINSPPPQNQKPSMGCSIKWK
ncbi:hypothetical protein A2164_03650 [Candidatus Curtissbacteria bacterium RBG_13_35_7]|uniref:Thioredoxin domain-containing protein n=1 Tax=Candidatus Curtissbacteria bacterium RBG_13_35_7 TaxID=1797705 RepID=A0A1F5G3S5_9BACT|nr:MAG: hypothetical protein A2164_03650 [Candidatus Curtissbacteria bacterium RBG_13_35_7]